MGSFFRYDNAVFRFIGNIGRVWILNLLFLLCCCPVITIGAAETALHYCTIRLVKNRDYGIFKMFFHSFRENFVQAGKIWLIMGPVGLLLLWDYWFFKNTIPEESVLRIPVLFAIGAAVMLWVFMFTYVWAVQSYFTDGLRQTMKNALLMSIRHLHSTIAILLSDIIAAAAAGVSLKYAPMISPVLFLLGPAGIVWMNSLMFVHIFSLYAPEETETEDTEIENEV